MSLSGLKLLGKGLDNPDQRIAQDCGEFTDAPLGGIQRHKPATQGKNTCSLSAYGTCKHRHHAETLLQAASTLAWAKQTFRKRWLGGPSKLRILQFLALLVQNIMLILLQSSLLFNISRDLFYFVVVYSVVLCLACKSHPVLFSVEFSISYDSE